MKKVKQPSEISFNQPLRPAITPEAREDQMINLATKRAEQQLIDGTASSQVITHYLKLGSSKAKKEIEALEKQIELMQAKIDALQQANNTEHLYMEAIRVMSVYTGNEAANDQDIQ